MHLTPRQAPCAESPSARSGGRPSLGGESDGSTSSRALGLSESVVRLPPPPPLGGTAVAVSCLRSVCAIDWAMHCRAQVSAWLVQVRHLADNLRPTLANMRYGSCRTTPPAQGQSMQRSMSTHRAGASTSFTLPPRAPLVAPLKLGGMAPPALLTIVDDTTSAATSPAAVCASSFASAVAVAAAAVASDADSAAATPQSTATAAAAAVAAAAMGGVPLVGGRALRSARRCLLQWGAALVVSNTFHSDTELQAAAHTVLVAVSHVPLPLVRR